MAVPLKQGAGAITTLTRANGILRIDAAFEGEMHGSEVEIDLLVPLPQVERTLLCTGSHDLCLDVLNDFLRKQDPAYPLASTHVGSLGGIMALKQGMCHLAGSHLLDPKDGSYNTSYIRKHLAGRDIRIVTLVHREQGFIVAKGNPKKITGVRDLFGAGIRFINRQAGSGTRVLLDYELSRNDLDAGRHQGLRAGRIHPHGGGGGGAFRQGGCGLGDQECGQCPGARFCAAGGRALRPAYSRGDCSTHP